MERGTTGEVEAPAEEEVAVVVVKERCALEKCLIAEKLRSL
jgi:hypothetical protein